MRTSRRMLRQARAPLATCLFLSGLISVLMLATPYVIVLLFNTVLPTGSFAAMAVLGFIAAGAALTRIILESAQAEILLRTGLWLNHTLGEQLVSVGLQSARPCGDRDADQRALDAVTKVLIGPETATLFKALWSVTLVAALFAIDMIFGLIGLCAALVALAAISQASWTIGPGNECAESSAKTWLRQASLSAIWFNRNSVSVWEQLNRDSISKAMRNAKSKTRLVGVCAGSGAVAHCVLICAGIHLLIAGSVGPGHLLAASYLLVSLTAALTALAAVRLDVGAALAGRTHLMSKVPDAPTPSKLGPGPLRLNGISVIYPGRTVPAISDVSLTLEPGRCLLVSGAAGSGKSTLLAVLAGAIEPAIGSAEVGGQSIGLVQRTARQRPIGYLPSSAGLIEGTVEQNITSFTSTNGMSAAAAAARAGVQDTFDALPHGYATAVGRYGSLLSAREQSAVALARAFHWDPLVVVLDQPEVALDDRAVAVLADTLAAMMDEGVAVVLATEHPALTALADQSLMMHEGRIARHAVINHPAFHHRQAA
jgi:ATP-binding cassette, subfamily C, bacterial PrsD